MQYFICKKYFKEVKKMCLEKEKIYFKEIGNRIICERIKQDLTQEAFCNKIGMSLCHYRRIEQGLVNIKISTLKKICDGFGITMSMLLSTDYQYDVVV